MTSARPLDHAQVTLLLPWYVNGSLDGSERAQVALHLEHCAACREESARLRALGEVVADEPTPHLNAERALLALNDRIDAAQRIAPAQPSLAKHAWQRLASLFRPVPGLAVATAAALLVVFVMASSERAGNYQTVTTPASEAGASSSILVAFVPGLTAEQRDALLAEWALVAIAEPDATGLVELSPLQAQSADAMRALAERLDAHPLVRLARVHP